MDTKRRYQSWGKYLKSKREVKFRSAREFCAQVRIGISYAQYSRYESGEQLPNLEQALMLCQQFGVSAAEALVEWALGQVSDPQIRGEIESLARKVEGPGFLTQAAVPLDDVIVFNRSHLNLFRSDAAYRDIFTYVNSFAPEWISPAELAAAIGISRARIDEMLARLHDLGVVTFDGAGKCRAAKRNFYFPDDEEFFELRNVNLAHNATAIMKRLKSQDLVERKAYRGLISRELTAEQLDLVVAKLDSVMSAVVGMPETPKPERIYSLCLLMGERFLRPRLPAKSGFGCQG